MVQMVGFVQERLANIGLIDHGEEYWTVPKLPVKCFKLAKQGGKWECIIV